ncbi:hypothetical protein B0H66DRAFT_560330 [Apodospora peruviana]|uniref:Zn(2)-C6 fungal-type domain-containing protein n=1 Tax=Apodospora peruviana TaxID=516989 RepID=A0AAE0M200_9PEZI|nr:hypothetical protein B0H66DRAFT_560330 [Apodospora peruviana]
MDRDAASSSGHGSRLDTASPDASSGGELAVRVRRRPIPRRGHTKSRRGCFSCKARKVKCQENHPKCVNCTRIGLVCEYPEPQQPQSLIRRVSSSPAATVQSIPTPIMFTMDDLRFFHHFVVTAYPPLPIQRADIWADVAALSHEFDYLVHAMLGLAASHLSLYGADYKSQALSHRVKAIQSLNKSLSNPCSSLAEGDARFAAILALAFQASCMPDGMNEFLSMIRGCHVIAETSMPQSFEESMFGSFTSYGYTSSIRALVAPGALNLTAAEEALFDEFILSLRALGPLVSNPIEVHFLASTERITKLARTSVVEAFAQFTAQYDLIAGASNEEFAAFANPTNYPAQLLLIHFMLIEYAVGELALGSAGERFAFRKRVCIAWLDQLVDTLPEEYQSYIEWPKRFGRIMKSPK